VDKIGMGGVPKQRHTKSRRNKRRMHLRIKKVTLVSCPKCGKQVQSHTICWNCGYYKGSQVIDVLAKLEKKERKQREKEMAEEEKEGGKEKELSMEELSRK